MSSEQYYGSWAHVPGPVRKSAERGLVDILHNHGLSGLYVPSYTLFWEGRLLCTSGDMAEVAAAVLNSAACLMVEKPHLEVSRSAFWFRGGGVFNTDNYIKFDAVDLVCEELEDSDTARLRQQWLEKEQAAHLGVHLKLQGRACLNFWATVRLLETVHRLAFTLLEWTRVAYAVYRNATWLKDAPVIIREWSYSISEVAYEAMRRRVVQLKRHHRVVRLDKIRLNALGDRVLPGTLFRIGMAIVELLWMEVRRSGLSMFVVDRLGDFAYVVGFEVGTDMRLKQQRSVFFSSAVF